MTKINVRIGQVWEWNYKNRLSSIYLIVNKGYKRYSPYDDGNPHDLFELVELNGNNTRIQIDYMTADNWKLLIDVEQPNR